MYNIGNKNKKHSESDNIENIKTTFRITLTTNCKP